MRVRSDNLRTDALSTPGARFEAEETPLNTRSAMVVVLAAIVLDAVGIGLIFPILPALMRELAGSDEISTRYGAMLAVYAAMQFLFAPVLGALSDRAGRRPVLLLSLAGATVDYVFMALAPQLWMLFLGRALAGLTSANMAVATAVMADITPQEDRARRFGYLHAGFGLGFIIGPILGGVLGAVHVRAPFLAAAALCALNLLLALFALPETRPATLTEAPPRREVGLTAPLRPLLWALGQRALRPLLALYVALNLVGQTYGTVWVLFSEDRFGWDSRMIGASLAAYGVCHAASQGLLAGPATARLGAVGAITLGLLAEAGALVILAMTTQGWALFLLLPVLAVSGLSLPALQSLLSNAVDADHQGRLQGVLSALVSLTAIFGPLVFSAIYAATRTSWNGMVWVSGAAVYALAAPLLWSIRTAWRRAP